MPPSPITVRLKPGRHKSLQHGHPWVFSGAVESIEGEAKPGAVANVLSHGDTWLARGLVNPDAGLAIRLYTWNPDTEPDLDLFRLRIDSAIRLRERLFRGREDTTAYRLVFSESDGCSGLIVDRYADTLAIHVSARVLVPFLGDLVAHLLKRTGATEAVCFPGPDAVARDGLDADAVVKASTVTPGTVDFLENGLRFRADLSGGQKTGYFLDQRENRLRVAAYAAGKSVLSAYCYTGAFEMAAAREGATSILGIDSSEPALEQAEMHFQQNNLSVDRKYLRGDVTRVLRTLRDSGKSFGLIVLDPPRFVSNRQQKDKGLRAYKDINLWALKLLEPDGILATFSCSGLVTASDFEEVLCWAATDAGRSVQILETLTQPPDHPVLPAFPESRYLKGLICTAG